jgi:hypothetical protein
VQSLKIAGKTTNDGGMEANQGKFRMLDPVKTCRCSHGGRDRDTEEKTVGEGRRYFGFGTGFARVFF